MCTSRVVKDYPVAEDIIMFGDCSPCPCIIFGKYEFNIVSINLVENRDNWNQRFPLIFASSLPSCSSKLACLSLDCHPSQVH